ncbi:MAG: serine/threonine protein phosphatase [Acutalibacteraceae bacterium]
MDLNIMTAVCFLLIFISVSEISENASRVKPAKEKQKSPQIYITGDKHRNFKKIIRFCRRNKTSEKDILIILGDSGINYFCNENDKRLKNKLSKLKITLFCIYGNKEKRPSDIEGMRTRIFHGGRVYYEPDFRNILYAYDGDVFEFKNKNYIVIGGAHSVDKTRCIELGRPFWENEMPGLKIKRYVRKQLNTLENSVHGVLSHTCPIDYIPTEMFVSNNKKRAKKLRFEPDIDRSTERWLGKIEKTINYSIWYCGHYHTDKTVEKIHMLYDGIEKLR